MQDGAGFDLFAGYSKRKKDSITVDVEETILPKIIIVIDLLRASEMLCMGGFICHQAIGYSGLRPKSASLTIETECASDGSCYAILGIEMHAKVRSILQKVETNIKVEVDGVMRGW